MYSCFVWVVLDVLPLRGIAQLAQHVPDAVRGEGYAAQVAITARSQMAARTALIDVLTCIEVACLSRAVYRLYCTL